MSEIITMGETIVEIMRAELDSPLNKPGIFKGPYPSGAPAIFIDTVARLGHSSAIISGVGQDDFGDMMVSRLENDGVDTSMIIRNDRISTGCAFVMYFSNGDRKFIFHIGNTPAVEAPVPEREKLEGCRFFHIMGCSMMANTDFGRRIVKTAQLAHSMGSAVSFDPNVRPELMKDPECMSLIDDVLSITRVFLPGKGELATLSGVEGIENGVKAMFEKYPLMDIIVVKDGSRGSLAYTRETSSRFGIYSVPVVDTTGAGDSFDAAFLCGMLEKKSLEDCLKYATAAASLNTAAFGPMEGKISIENVTKMILEDNQVV